MLAGLALGAASGLTGCSADSDTTTTAPTTLPPSTTDTAATTNPGETTATSTALTPTEPATQTTTAGSGALRERSHIRPTDGFASPGPWVEGSDVSIRRVTEPTREAFEAAVEGSGPRLVVFETSGTIDLGGQRTYLTIPGNQIWIAGQTAPSPGITFVRGGVSLSGNESVIQHLRFRAGDAGHDSGANWEPDSLRTGDDTFGNVIDHCTATWGIDETLSVGFETADTTISNCVVAEALHDSTHSEGRHGFGSIGAGGDSQRACWLGIVWALNSGRNPRIGGTEHVIANTVVSKYDRAAGLDRESTASFVGNAYYRPGDRPIRGQGSGDRISKVYIEDNVVHGDYSLTNQPYIEHLETPPAWPSGLSTVPVDQVRAHNLAHAGARPADRTHHDRRVLEKVRQGTGEYIDSQASVGGYPDLAVNTRPLEVPETGLREWLADHARAVETRHLD